MDNSELRDMSDEQLKLTLDETVEHLFRLRMQAQTERLDAPSELKRNRRLIARIKTLRREREIERGASSPAEVQTQPEAKKGS